MSTNNRIGLIGLSVLVLTATAPVARAQQNPFLNSSNPATPLLNEITVNPIPSGSGTLPPRTENPVLRRYPLGYLPTQPEQAWLIVGERGGYAAQHVGTSCESKRYWNRKRNDASNTGPGNNSGTC
jgi:hypothetical protein